MPSSHSKNWCEVARFRLQLSVCCVWQTTHHFCLQPWPEKKHKKRWDVTSSDNNYGDLFIKKRDNKQEYSTETPNLIKQFISFWIHYGELSESFISHKADFMTILKTKL